jgi:hypothetical protein
MNGTELLLALGAQAEKSARDATMRGFLLGASLIVDKGIEDGGLNIATLFELREFLDLAQEQ